MKNNFFKSEKTLYNLNDVVYINAENMGNFSLTVYFNTLTPIEVVGLDAIDLVMMANPSLIEGRFGKKIKFPKHKWIIHNLVAHPLMQILALLGFKKQAIWIHDATIPRPIQKI